MLIDQRFDVFIECFYIKWQLSESFDESGISKDFINAFCQIEKCKSATLPNVQKNITVHQVSIVTCGKETCIEIYGDDVKTVERFIMDNL